MNTNLDPALTYLVGSRARLLALAVLANATGPLTGYRVSRVADLPRQKVYPILRRAVTAGIIREFDDGFVLVDSGIRDLLRRRLRIEWSEDRRVAEGARTSVTRDRVDDEFGWYDPTKYRANPRVGRRYAKEFRRPPAKGPSRKTGWE